MSIFTKIISIFMMIPALLGLYKQDADDTVDAYVGKVGSIGIENTIESAVPQTEIYNMINEHFASPLPEGKTEKKAIVIGYDGCRADALTLVGDSYSGIGKMVDAGAFVKLAYCGGVNLPAENTQDTSTAPGWCAVLTGVWADQNGIYSNGVNKTLEYKTLFTTLVENKVIDSANFITSWKGHFVNDDSTYKLEKQYCEDNKLNVAFNYCNEDVASALTAIKDIRQDDCSDFIFAIYEGTDHAGHTFGFSTNNPIYESGFKLNDVLAYMTLEAVESRDTYATEDWLIIITSDHGGYGTDHGGPSMQERIVFIVTNK